jgi:hypothetical protein
VGNIIHFISCVIPPQPNKLEKWQANDSEKKNESNMNLLNSKSSYWYKMLNWKNCVAFNSMVIAYSMAVDGKLQEFQLHWGWFSVIPLPIPVQKFAVEPRSSLQE